MQVGQYWFLPKATLRTKGIRDGDDDPAASWDRLESVAYKRFRTWKLICLIDPRWITTSTALVSFRSGSVQIAGLIHINKVAARFAVASPLFLGTPDYRTTFR